MSGKEGRKGKGGRRRGKKRDKARTPKARACRSPGTSWGPKRPLWGREPGEGVTSLAARWPLIWAEFLQA